MGLSLLKLLVHGKLSVKLIALTALTYNMYIKASQFPSFSLSLSLYGITYYTVMCLSAFVYTYNYQRFAYNFHLFDGCKLKSGRHTNKQNFCYAVRCFRVLNTTGSRSAHVIHFRIVIFTFSIRAKFSATELRQSNLLYDKYANNF